MDIFVYIDAPDLTSKPTLMGILHAERVRGKEIFSFNANKAWLDDKRLSFLDADLQQFPGVQYAPENKSIFGIFSDSCPDRWGKVLMQRREQIKAHDEGRAVKKLDTSDYLLGVYDGNRMGALRFKSSMDGDFLDNNSSMASPPITSLRELEQASLKYEDKDAEESPNYRKWIQILYSPGSSLGGARPKSNVIDAEGNLWIAKFPSKHDLVDAGAWEFIVTSMAHEFGLKTPSIKVVEATSRFHTFLTKRFERYGNGKRKYFASAMTLLGYQDGDNAMDGASYLEMADFIERHGTQSQKDDLIELWKRVVFNIAISNCDDHLRNHGFLLSPKGWQLSPVYDLTPNAQGKGLALNVDEADNSLNFDIAIKTAPYYGIDNALAVQLVERCKQVCSTWRERAKALRIPRSEQDAMAPAFALCE